MFVADETTEGLFVCFDGVMTKLHSIRARDVNMGNYLWVYPNPLIMGWDFTRLRFSGSIMGINFKTQFLIKLYKICKKKFSVKIKKKK